MCLSTMRNELTEFPIASTLACDFNACIPNLPQVNSQRVVDGRAAGASFIADDGLLRCTYKRPDNLPIINCVF